MTPGKKKKHSTGEAIDVRIRDHFAQVRASTQDRIVLKEMMGQPTGNKLKEGMAGLSNSIGMDLDISGRIPK